MPSQEQGAAIGGLEGRAWDIEILLSESARRCQNIDEIIVAVTGMLTLYRGGDGDLWRGLGGKRVVNLYRYLMVGSKRIDQRTKGTPSLVP